MNSHQTLARWILALALAVALPAAVAAQVGPRTISNSRSQGLDAGTIGDRLGISSADLTTKKMELTREIEYWDTSKWLPSSVTWLYFEQGDDGAITISEKGPGVIEAISAGKAWDLTALEGGGWKATPKKGGGKIDLSLDTVFEGKPYTVGAVVPKFKGAAAGGVYRGTDFLFFVVQKKLPALGAG